MTLGKTLHDDDVQVRRTPHVHARNALDHRQARIQCWHGGDVVVTDCAPTLALAYVMDHGDVTCRVAFDFAASLAHQGDESTSRAVTKLVGSVTSRSRSRFRVVARTRYWRRRSRSRSSMFLVLSYMTARRKHSHGGRRHMGALKIGQIATRAVATGKTPRREVERGLCALILSIHQPQTHDHTSEINHHNKGCTSLVARQRA